jgi:tRNA-dihydrouridine synthase B
MAGVTDASYRQLIKMIAPEVIVYTEFLSTDAIHYGAKKTMQMIHFDPKVECPFIVQVFGKDPEHFLSAAKVIEQLGADGIDINMGCPAAKVVSSCHGSALIRNPDLAAELVHATKKAVKIPVSVKTRLGWDKIETLIPFCERIIEAGAEALAIHGRRYWDPIYELKNAFPHIPIIGNGDIACAADAVAKIKNLDGVMVGRGTFGNPWVMAEICDALRHREKVTGYGLRVPKHFSHQELAASNLSFDQKIPFILEHCELAIRLKGEKRGMLEMRRHLASYVRGQPGAAEMRARLVVAEKIEDVKAVLCV